jgi:hypothetical protein
MLADVYLELRPAFRPDQIRQLRDTIPAIGREDRLIIRVERSDAHQTGKVFDLLDEHGFDYQPKGGAEDYNIIARRK